MDSFMKLLIVTTSLMQVQYASCSVEVTLHMISYKNPSMTDYDGIICDTFTRHCDQVFHICADEYHGHDWIDSEYQCAYYSGTTEVYHQWNNIDFDHDLLGLLNPIVFTIPKWETGFLLKVGVWDADNIPNRHERVDFIKHRYNKVPMEKKGKLNNTELFVLRGVRRHRPTSLSVKITTYCTEGHIHKHEVCDKFCVPTDNARGHYNCTEGGDKICLPGWEDEHGDCTKSINDCPDEHRCKNGGVCVDDHLTYRCKCPPKFKGPVCDDGVDPCEKNPCGKRMFCVGKPNGGFECNVRPPIISRSSQVTTESGVSPLVLGLIIGLLLLVIIVVILIAVFWRQRQKRRLKNQGTNAVADTSTSGQQTSNLVGASAQTNPGFSHLNVGDRDVNYQNQINGAVAATAASQTPFTHMTSSSTNTPGGAKAMEAGLLSPPPYRETDVPQTSGNAGIGAGGGNFSNPVYDNVETPPVRPPPRGSTSRGVATNTAAGNNVGSGIRSQGVDASTGDDQTDMDGLEKGRSVKALADLYELPIKSLIK